jgi:hypothetical protein
VKRIVTTEAAIRDLLDAHRHTLNQYNPPESVLRIRRQFEQKLAAILGGDDAGKAHGAEG